VSEWMVRREKKMALRVSEWMVGKEEQAKSV
jgi:hypothetical protein